MKSVNCKRHFFAHDSIQCDTYMTVLVLIGDTVKIEQALVDDLLELQCRLKHLERRAPLVLLRLLEILFAAFCLD